MCFIVYVWTCTGSQFKYFGSFKIILFTGKTSWHLHTTLFPAPFCTACTYSFFTTMNLQKMMYGGKQHFQCSLFFFFPSSFLPTLGSNSVQCSTTYVPYRKWRASKFGFLQPIRPLPEVDLWPQQLRFAIYRQEHFIKRAVPFLNRDHICILRFKGMHASNAEFLFLFFTM